MASNQWSWVTTVPTELSHLVGILNKRMKALEGKLRRDDILREAVVAKTAAYTATDRDKTILCDATSAAFSVTLPAVQGLSGREYTIKKTDSSANAVTIDGSGSETIDDGTTAVIQNQYESVTVQCDGAEWWIL